MNRYDINKVEDLYFNVNVASLEDSALKMKMILQNQDSLFLERLPAESDTEFLRNIWTIYP